MPEVSKEMFLRSRYKKGQILILLFLPAMFIAAATIPLFKGEPINDKNLLIASVTTLFFVYMIINFFYRSPVFYFDSDSSLMTPYRRSTGLRIITYGFQSKLYSAGSLRNGNWTELLTDLHPVGVKTGNE